MVSRDIRYNFVNENILDKGLKRNYVGIGDVNKNKYEDIDKNRTNIKQ